MSIFDKIFDKLGFGKRKIFTPTSQSGGGGGSPTVWPAAGGSSSTAPRPSAPSQVPAGPVAISEVDVMSKLEAMAAASSQKLNWKTSIVDLMKLLGLDSSLAERKELAVELGCPADKMGDSAEMNMWLHKAVLHNLAQNGGNIPAHMLD
ncbi:MAG: DUF3597 domain-containing protein [Lysobacterales bacterium]